MSVPVSVALLGSAVGTYSYSIDSCEATAFRWASHPVDTTERSGDLVRERNVVDREPINVQSLMVESQFYNYDPFEYDCPDERLQSPRSDEEFTISTKPTSPLGVHCLVRHIIMVFAITELFY